MTPKGMTLLEVVIAMAVVAIALFAAMTMIALSAKQDFHAKERMIALDAAKTKMEELQNSPFSGVPSFDGTSFDVEGLEPASTDSDTNEGRVVVTTVNDALVDVEVFVEWHGIDGDQSLSFKTQLTSR